MKKRRAIEEIGISFLDVICCGFGAIILLLMITKVVAPSVLEATTVDLEGQVASKRDAVFEIRGHVETLTRQLSDKERDFDKELLQLAKLQQQTSDVLSKFEATQDVADEQLIEEAEMARAKQSLTDEMERLLGMNFKRSSQTIGGITVDSEHIIFVIDNSGSMYNYAWSAVIRKLQETLNIYPNVKGIQVLNDNGRYLFPRYARTWMSDSPALRKSIINKMRNWDADSNSSPVEGIEEAVTTFYDPDKKISIYVFGDDFQGTSIERVVDTIDQINVADADGTRRVRIHAVGFPVLFQGRRHPPSVYRFSALMRELTYRNNGTFVGLPYIQ